MPLRKSLGKSRRSRILGGDDELPDWEGGWDEGSGGSCGSLDPPAGCVACVCLGTVVPSLGSLAHAGGSRSRPLLFPHLTLSLPLLPQQHSPCLLTQGYTAEDLVLPLHPAPRRLPADDCSPRKMPPNSKRAALASSPAGKCTWTAAEHGSHHHHRHASLALTAPLTHGDMAGVKKKDGAFTRTGQACDRCKVCSKPLPAVTQGCED